MNIVEIDTTQGDLKVLALAVQALIDTHPDKEAFKKKFLEVLDDSELHSLHSPSPIKNFSVALLQDILRTASYSSRVDSAPSVNDQHE